MTRETSAANEYDGREPFGTVESGIPLPESMKDVPLIPAKDVPPLTFEPVAATAHLKASGRALSTLACHESETEHPWVPTGPPVASRPKNPEGRA